MKKFLVLLLISLLAIFVFAGCDSVIPSEGEGEGEGEPEGVTVEIANSVPIKGIDYVKGGANTITVTFPAPVEGIVQADISDCTSTIAATKFLFPTDESNTVFAGTIDFACLSDTTNPCGDDNPCGEDPCCEAVITIISGACEVDECIVLPVIVDCAPPAIPVFAFNCLDCNPCPDQCEPSDGAYFTFTSMGGDVCNPADACSDDCSGVGDWSFTVGDICDTCVLIEGTGCPIEGTADCGCLPWATETEVTKTYTVTFKISDKVGNTATQDYTVVVDTDSVVTCMEPVVDET